MTTDLALAHTDNGAVVTAGASDALARLGEWVTAARHAHQLVAPLVDTAFVPDAYRPKVDPRATAEQRAEARQLAVANATAAVLQGLSLGIDPLVALQQIYIVHGRPGLYAKMMVALVQAHGHEVWTEDQSDSRAVVAGRRKGTDAVERVTITMEMARKAGWTSNQAYTKTPQDMLWSRAASRVCDRIASDVLKGIASVEEIQDELAPANGAGTRTVAPPRRRALPAAPDMVDEPPLDDDLPAAAQPAPAAEPEPGITAAQQRKLHALLRERGLTDREAGLAFISMTLGRDVESTKDITRTEAGAVIQTLDSAEPAEPAVDQPAAEDVEP